MNLPENSSAAATRIYNLLSADPSPKTVNQLTDEYAKQPAAEELHKAIATVDSLIIKGIVSANKETGETTYTLIKPSSAVGPDEEADAKEEYVEKTDANAEEERMIAILESNDKKLPEAKLFDLYEKGQLPAAKTSNATGEDEIKKALQELTDAGIVALENDAYSIKK